MRAICTSRAMIGTHPRNRDIACLLVRELQRWDAWINTRGALCYTCLTYKWACEACGRASGYSARRPWAFVNTRFYE
jgi:hypothetical protein